MRPQQRGGGRRRIRLVAAGASIALVGGGGSIGAIVAAAPGQAAVTVAQHHDHNSCNLGHGIKHVVQISFDNVHFFRDNPNVPSDLQLMPNLLHFIEHNGTMLSNNHTPLIAHTTVDLLTTATGLYGDRQGMPISNSYQAYNADGTTDPAESFTYWTDPIFDTARTPNAGHDVNPNMVYSAVPPSTAKSPVKPDTVTPAPWVPYTRAGCNVGEVATANQVLENAGFDIPKVFGAGSPEAQQLAADSGAAPFFDNEARDYVGLGVHCAKGNGVCADAKAVKFGQTSATNTAAPDVLANEPGGYNGYQALFGSRYIAPVLGAGTPNLTHDGVPVTNSAGNLTDLFGNELDNPFASAPAAGFPGFGDINAAQSLAYTADMLEHGVPVVNLYIADIHGNHFIPGLTSCNNAPDALGSGTQCYLDQAAYYNKAFGVFFKRLAQDGITPKNTVFAFSSDEGDHMAGANVGRAIQPTPANCNGTTIVCTYPAGSFGELGGNIQGMLATQKGNTTPYGLEADTAPEFYLNGNPGPTAPVVRKFEQDVAGLTAFNPYTNTTQPITNFLANPVEESILHMVNADLARTPTMALFAKPDYFFFNAGPTCKTSCVSQTTGFAWDHGDYAAEINTNFLGIVGPGVKKLGLDGPAADAGATSSGANSGQVEVVDNHFPGPWVDETDIRPTILYLTGLKDDYEHDGRVVTQVLSDPNHALRGQDVTKLGECYKQLNSSVGKFGAATLQASTNAIESTSTGDSKFKSIDALLRVLNVARDRLAGLIKGELEAAAFQDKRVHHAAFQVSACRALIHAASELANHS
jgi:hypothetical protein